MGSSPPRKLLSPAPTDRRGRARRHRQRRRAAQGGRRRRLAKPLAFANLRARLPCPGPADTRLSRRRRRPLPFLKGRNFVRPAPREGVATESPEAKGGAEGLGKKSRCRAGPCGWSSKAWRRRVIVGLRDEGAEGNRSGGGRAEARAGRRFCPATAPGKRATFPSSPPPGRLQRPNSTLQLLLADPKNLTLFLRKEGNLPYFSGDKYQRSAFPSSFKVGCILN